ncbi:MAG: metal-dependent hydrolase [Patescibacteria group bacterium]|jgi:inner membrane protein
MTGKTHKAIGITIGMGSFIAMQDASYMPATFAAVLLFSYFGALLPDIDQPASEIWDKLPFGSGHAVGHLVDPFIKHRNITHSILGYAIFNILIILLLNSLPLYWGVLPAPVIIAFGLAYLAHLLADMFTVEGIPLFYPWKRFFGIPPKPFDGIRIETGHWFENLIIFPVANIILISLIVSNWSNLHMILFK